MILLEVSGRVACTITPEEKSGTALINSIRQCVKNADTTLGNNFYLTYNGRLLRDDSVIISGVIHATPRLPGGKGGFGSMLRAIGAQIEKTTNREACRDLSGRRLRDINEEKRLKKWIAQQAEREKEAEEKKKKKLEKLCSEPKHEFQDSEYDKVRSEMVEKVHSAVEQGLQASASLPDEPSTSSAAKRKKPNKEKSKGMLWIDEDLGTDSSEEDDEETEENSSKKLKAQ